MAEERSYLIKTRLTTHSSYKPVSILPLVRLSVEIDVTTATEIWYCNQTWDLGSRITLVKFYAALRWKPPENCFA